MRTLFILFLSNFFFNKSKLLAIFPALINSFLLRREFLEDNASLFLSRIVLQVKI